jgi:ABC-2 type transport system permease protein
MRLKNILVLTRREFLSRVRTKAFWLSTIILPIFMVAVTVTPSLLMSRTPSHQNMVVVDETGQIGSLVKAEIGSQTEAGNTDGGPITFEIEIQPAAADPAAQRAELDRKVLDETLDAWVWLTPDVLSPREDGERHKVEYHGRNISNVITQQQLTTALSSAVRTVRLREAGLPEEQINQLSTRVGLETFRVTEQGQRAEEGVAGAILAYALGFLLYMCFLLYGAQVVNGVLEEKSSRIVEVMLASVRPSEMMLGKLLGICLAALTQLVIWIGTLVVLTAPGILATLAWLPQRALPSLSVGLALHFFGFFLLGFFLIATLYAAIGAAFNTLQEAQQLLFIPMMAVMLPFFLMFAIINAPDSKLAVIASLIPLFTPMLMVTRIAISAVPVWQIALSYLLTTAFVAFMVWLCARIYRTGILMYGKKPTFAELLRWMRHS